MTVEHVQTKREIEAQLQRLGGRPKRKLGQHFLIDGNLMRRLVECADIEPDDMVIEVGAGTGGLTDLLMARARRLLCVEVDRQLYGLLAERIGNSLTAQVDPPDVRLVHTDVLASKHRLAPEVDQAIRAFEETSSGRGCVKLVANLPYQVATPLIMNLLIDYPAVRLLCFTVQAEVAQRLTSKPGCKAFGPLSIVAQSLCSIDDIAKLPARVFWPRPAVDSMMVRMRVGQAPFSDRDELRRFVSFVRAVFEHRRKTLRSALRYVLPEESLSRICDRFDGSRRPEAFTVNEWLSLFGVATD